MKYNSLLIYIFVIFNQLFLLQWINESYKIHTLIVPKIAQSYRKLSTLIKSFCKQVIHKFYTYWVIEFKNITQFSNMTVRIIQDQNHYLPSKK